MLLNTEELLELAHGDVEPERLANLLDRLEECPESAAALQVLVSLKANREEALEALREAAESDTSIPVPFPQRAVVPAPAVGWATQGLRLAASIAIVGLLGVWAASSLLFSAGSVHELAITEFQTVFRAPEDIELTAAGTALAAAANRELHARNYAAAADMLADAPADPEGLQQLYLGMAQYWLEDYEAAVETLSAVQDLATVSDSGVKLQALWYEANALLKLDRGYAALPLVEEVATSRFLLLAEEAAPTYDALCDVLGVNKAGRD